MAEELKLRAWAWELPQSFAQLWKMTLQSRKKAKNDKLKIRQIIVMTIQTHTQ